MNIITRSALYRKWKLKGRIETSIKIATRELEELRLYYGKCQVGSVKQAIMKLHRRIHILYGRYMDFC